VNLTLRDDWQMFVHLSGFILFKRAGNPDVLSYAIMAKCGDYYAYPFGEWGSGSGELCASIQEAHEYLIKKGSESPWEVVE